MAINYFTGVHGTCTFGTETALAEFSLKLDRSAATHARSGYHTDLQVPGKLVATGTFTRIMINKNLLVYAQEGTLFNVVGALTAAGGAGSGSITLTINNCFLTSDEFKFSDANNISSEPATFAVSDADTDLTIVEV